MFSLFTIGTRVAPVAAAVVVIATLIVCVSKAQIPRRTNVAILLRNWQRYAVFCAGLTTVDFTLVLTWSVNYQFQHELLENETNASVSAIHKYCKVVRVIGVLSAFGLPILAFFNTMSYPDVHQYATYWFFALEVVALITNTISTFKHSRLNKVSNNLGYTTDFENPESSNPWDMSKLSIKRTFNIQVVLASLFLFAFLLYIPIGLALVADFQRLTIKDCLAFNLGDQYCTDTMRLNDTETKLWNYDNDHSVNQMRSVSQLACILLLVGYSLSF